MKKVLLLLFAFLAAPLRADTFRFTERLTDTATATGVSTVIGCTVTGSLRLTNLADVVFTDTNTVYDIKIGSLEVSGPLALARTRSLNGATIAVGNSLGKQVGTITLTRAGALLNVSINISDTGTASIVAGNLAAASGTEAGGFYFTVNIGPATYMAPTYFKATKTLRTAGAAQLRSYTITGGFDTMKPTVAISAPTAGKRILDGPPFNITVAGKASDDFGLREVRIYVGTNLVQLATNFANGSWSAPLTLEAGPQAISAESVDLAGNVSMRAKAAVTCVQTAPLSLTIDNGGIVTGATNGQRLEIGKVYTLTANPKLGFLSGGWTGTVTNAGRALKFTMVEGASLHAVFATNYFPVFATLYSGLFHVTEDGTTNRYAATNSGYFNITLTPTGSGSGKLILEGKTIPFSGMLFDLTYTSTITIKRVGKPNLTLHLELGVNEGRRFAVGTVESDGFSAYAQSVAAGYRDTPWNGRYTFAFPPQEDNAGGFLEPKGTAVGTINVTGGLAAMNGTLPDGSKFTASAPMGALSGGSFPNESLLPMYASLQGGKGLVMGYFTFTPQVAPWSVAGTEMRWVKAPAPADKLYPEGLDRTVYAYAMRYVLPAANRNGFTWTNGVMQLTDGNLTNSILKDVTATRTSIVVSNDTANTHIKIDPTTGLVTGDFKHPVTTNLSKIYGVVIQVTNTASGDQTPITGFFTGTNRAGQVQISKHIEQ